MPSEREQTPCVLYRVTVQLPVVVSFPSATFRVDLVTCLPSGRHELTGKDDARAAETVIATFHNWEHLVAAVYFFGVPVRVDTLGATIMRKMVREGCAIVVR